MGSKPVGISASRGAAVLGLSKYKTSLSAWKDIMFEFDPAWMLANGFDPSDEPNGLALEWGNAIETPLINYIERVFDEEIFDREAFRAVCQKLFVTCHIDGAFRTKPDRHSFVLHEGKTTNPFTFRKEWGEPGTDHVPVEYQCQAQHQMACTGADTVIITVAVLPKMQDELGSPDKYDLDAFVSMLGTMGDIHRYEIQRNQHVIDKMLEVYDAFIAKNIIDRIPPDPQSESDIRTLFKPPVGTVIADKKIERMSRERAAIKEEIRIAKERDEQLKVSIMDFMRRHANVDIDDKSVDRCILLDSNGKQLNSYNGKQFR